MRVDVDKHLSSHFPELRNSTLLVAVSGGVDSIVLADILSRLQYRLVLCHCNFLLRGSESLEDENFVRNFAKSIGVELYVNHFETKAYAKSQGISTQMAARDLRYQWFTELAKTLGCGYIATAHHADDNLETFLINLSRGSGLKGLLGIPEQKRMVVRPLLSFSRDQILNYALAQGLSWREDSSNTSSVYLRNFIRQEISPKLKHTSKGFLNNFKKTLEHLTHSEIILSRHIEDVRERIVQKDGIFYKMAIDDLSALSPIEPYLYELLHPFGFTQWADIKGLLTAQSGKYVCSQTHQIVKDRKHIIIAPKKEPLQEVRIEVAPTRLYNPISISIQECFTYKDNLPTCIYVDAEKVSWPLFLSGRKEKTSFYPLGMQGKKSLSKYFKDEKYTLFDKQSQWILYSSIQEVVWVVGKRADRRFGVSQKTTRILKVELFLE